MTTTSIIRDSIKSAIKDLRAIRRAKSSCMIVGYGFTIAIKDSFTSIRQIGDQSYNFSASWNKGSIYWSEKNAIKKLTQLQAERPELKLEVAHYNDLRDRTEKHVLFVLNSFVKLRNTKFA